MRIAFLVASTTLLAIGLLLSAVDPGIALAHSPGLRHIWPYLELGIAIAVAAFLASSCWNLVLWVRRRQLAALATFIAVVGVSALLVLLSRSEIDRRYKSAADDIFTSARLNAMAAEFGKDANKRKAAIVGVLGSKAQARRIRGLPRYSLYEYEFAVDGMEPFYVQMAIEGGRPQLSVRDRSDLAPQFAS